MLYEDNTHIATQDLLFEGVLHDIKRSPLTLQPVFEAFTNALEAIKIKSKSQSNFKGKIEIKIHASEKTDKTTEFKSLTIIDDGIGFNDEEYKRFNTFKDFTKGYKNLGSGRIQYAHYFDSTVIHSVYYDEEGKCKEREFIISKQENFLKKRAIVFNKFCKDSQAVQSGTTVTFYDLLENSTKYHELDAATLKESLLEKYIHYFCYNKSNLPEIKVEFYVQSELKETTTIEESDIPIIDKTESIDLSYSKISNDGKSIEKITKTENFKIDAFKISKDVLKTNNLKLVSKGEVVEKSNIGLQSLAKGDHIKGSKFLFLVSSQYIDLRDTNVRGKLNIPDRESFLKQGDIFTTEEILLDDIQEEVNSKINTMYPEIEKVKQKHNEDLDKLKEMFLLDDETAQSIKISVNDSESEILEKFYQAEAKKAASIDATIKESVDSLNKLDTTKPNYHEELKKEIDKLVKTIPLQNKKVLAHYIARRKLVLDLLDKVLDKKLDVQQSGREYDEALIHDLLFQQGSNDSSATDLWIVNEDFIYFKGSSNTPLNKTEINGEKLFKDSFSVEEEKYLKSLGENRKTKRPDVLLFPDEGKCIIIEFKAPGVNISEHLTQINTYAGLIRNYTDDKFQITTFYGYLLGEAIETRDVLFAESTFEESYQFDYLYRPSAKVVGFDGRANGSIYTEVIKYSTLLARARQRNKVFIDKLNINI